MPPFTSLCWKRPCRSQCSAFSNGSKIEIACLLLAEYNLTIVVADAISYRSFCCLGTPETITPKISRTALMARNSSERTPLRWQGIVFALAANLLLVTVANLIVSPLWPSALVWLTIGTALLAGAATAIYVGQRGGTHAFIGGVISIPLLALFILNGNWGLAVYAGASCALGGLLTEAFSRRRTR